MGKTHRLRYYTDLISECFPEFPVKDARLNESGWDNAVVELANDFIFRFPRRKENIVQLEREIKILEVIEKAVPIQVPKYEKICSKNDTTVVAGYRKLDGEPMESHVPLQVRFSNSLPYTSNALDRASEQIGSFLTSLHSIPQDDLKPANIRKRYGRAMNSYLRTRLKLTVKTLRPFDNGNTLNVLENAFEDYLNKESNFRYLPVLVHNDLLKDNILWNPVSGEIRGIIDWGDALFSDPARDFAGILYEFGPTFLEKILRHYDHQGSSDLQTRSAFFAAIIPLEELIRQVRLYGKPEETTLENLNFLISVLI